MKEFVNKHPIITLLLGLAALGTIEVVVRGFPQPTPPPQPSGGHLGFDADIPVVGPSMQGVPGFDGYGTVGG